jgi:iron complex transport system substrate-binding protein
MFMRKLLSVLLSLILLFSLTSCARVTAPDAENTQAPETSPEITPETEPDNTPAGPAYDIVTLTDQAGRTVTIEAEPSRIVSGYYISTSACIALGLTDRLVGIEAKANERNIYKLAAPELTGLPNVGTAKEFDLEGCIALKPDLVILPKKLKDSAETLSALGIPVILVDPENHEKLTESIKLIAAATGTEERAEELTAYYSEALNKISSLVADSEEPVVYLAGNSSYLSTAPMDMYQASLIRTAGGTNAGDILTGDDWTEVSYEQLLAMDPDIIVIPAEAAYTAEDLAADASLSGLKAVSNGSIYTMPSSFEPWDSPVPSGILGTMWMAAVLHENLYSFETFVSDAAGFYDSFYGFAADTSLISK